MQLEEMKRDMNGCRKKLEALGKTEIPCFGNYPKRKFSGLICPNMSVKKLFTHAAKSREKRKKNGSKKKRRCRWTALALSLKAYAQLKDRLHYMELNYVSTLREFGKLLKKQADAREKVRQMRLGVAALKSLAASQKRLGKELKSKRMIRGANKTLRLALKLKQRTVRGTEAGSSFFSQKPERCTHAL